MGKQVLRLLVLVAIGAGAAIAQQTTVFTYQGQLTDADQPANGSFDLQFALFGAAGGGTQIGTTQTVSAVLVSNGVFTVQLDFGVSAFPGANRYLEIGVRPAGTGSYTTLAPRQQISSTPYAIRTLSAATADALSSACIGCVTDAQIGSLAGSKVTGTIPAASVPTGSGNYVQNTTVQQANANFNIAGNGTIGGNLTVNGTLNANVNGNFIQNRSTPQSNANFNVSGNGTVGQNLVAGQVGVGLSGAPRSSLEANGTGWFENDDGPLVGVEGGVSISFKPGLSTGYVSAYDYANTTPRNLVLNGPGGNVGIGATTPVSRLDVNGTGWFEGNSAPLVNASKGTAVGLLSSPYTAGYVFAYDYQAAAPLNLLLNNSGGNVGIGTLLPVAPLDVHGTGWFTGDSTPLKNAGQGVAIGLNSSSVGYVSAYDYGSATPLTLSLNTAGGNVGIGTTTPGAKLGVQAAGTAIIGQTAAAHTASQSGVLGYSTGDGGVGVIGEADTGNAWGVYGTSTSPTGVGVYGKEAAGGFAMVAEGNTSQFRSSSGWVKAMAHVMANQQINRCYNSQASGSQATTPPCGFSLTTNADSNAIFIDFGFNIGDRFWSVTPEQDSGGHSIGVNAAAVGASSILNINLFYANQINPPYTFTGYTVIIF